MAAAPFPDLVRLGPTARFAAGEAGRHPMIEITTLSELTLDGKLALGPGASSKALFAFYGDGLRAWFHGQRAAHDAIMVGAGTVRADDPALTVRDVPGRDPLRPNPLRVVLGHPPEGARVLPAEVHDGALEPLLDDLGRRGFVQLLVEGGARVAWSFHQSGLVDQYVLYLAPALLGGDDGLPLFSGPGAPTMADVWRGRIDGIRRLGSDVRIDLVAGEGEGAVR